MQCACVWKAKTIFPTILPHAENHFICSLKNPHRRKSNSVHAQIPPERGFLAGYQTCPYRFVHMPPAKERFNIANIDIQFHMIRWAKKTTEIWGWKLGTQGRFLFEVVKVQRGLWEFDIASQAGHDSLSLSLVLVGSSPSETWNSFFCRPCNKILSFLILICKIIIQSANPERVNYKW